ncbi:type VI secretion system baseplate subunit TssE [Roseomonas xinghualingensis]|uniref:type VI secretion system baseplate subunit TssE n=1 Tax=Roseomonas xinghualingensis TaxID=2986475 RepID=UPI0021F1D13D|nr:type VI secretion system baseplate subunit TssE [Roseomonas sp. SXEYE001]MCV4209668.1 type VI secretion system baseplate subunit TssE [Roseomonas sp. SXEYE001]
MIPADSPEALDGTWRGARDRAQLPLLDRLIDGDPDRPQDPPMSVATALAILRTSVRADLEALLNTRRRWRSWGPSLTELEQSPIGWGLPDFAGGAFNDPRRREALRREVEACIRRFEPRFLNVSVSLAGASEQLSGTLQLRIDALLHADPAPEPISFQTILDANTTDFTVLAPEG